MTDVRDIGDVWWTPYASDVGLRSLDVPLSTKIEENTLRKYGWQLEPGIAES